MIEPSPLGGVPRVLSVAGSDPGGGAGIQADLRTFALHGVHGCAAIAALTVQDATAVRELFLLPPDFVARQVKVAFDDATVGAVKTGMLGTGAVATAVARVLQAAAARNVVVDPVLRATTGAALMDDDGLAAIRSALLPLATVVTPNAAEAGALLGTAPPRSVAEMRVAAVALRHLGPRWVLITGGDVEAGDRCVDVLAGHDGTSEMSVSRVPAGAMHGTGCTLSSAIAALLALGHAVPDACARAQRFVSAAIRAGDAAMAVPAEWEGA
jgi:hydroxymethylpyrimidine kinase/phosphomethylpyrimidine kinase